MYALVNVVQATQNTVSIRNDLNSNTIDQRFVQLESVHFNIFNISRYSIIFREQ